MSEVVDMVKEMAQAFRDELGVEPKPEQIARVLERVVRQFGGDRVYVPTRITFVLGDRFDLSGGVNAVMDRYQVSRRTAIRMRSRGK